MQICYLARLLQVAGKRVTSARTGDQIERFRHLDHQLRGLARREGHITKMELT